MSIRRHHSISAIITAVFLLPVAQAQDRVLEEITVTAQRREQSIQEVPISLEAYSGPRLNQEGFRAMEDLANFSPSTEINVRTQDQSASIRGLGTSSTNPGMEQAVPIFLDGVHFGRVSMITGAFLDMERVEILRGPQPVAFGMNATAGAFSLTTRKPGDQWEGDVTAEYGNFGRTSIEGGIGGPITDTLGIRVAGQWDRLTGFVRDIVTTEMFPNGVETGGRVTLQWAPTEKFEATLAADYMNRDREGDGNVMCRVKHPVVLNERAVTVPGLTSFDRVVDVSPIPTDCADGFRRVGIREGNENTYTPVRDIRQEDGRTGIIDMSNAKNMGITELGSAADNHKGVNFRLGLNYTFDNEISITTNSAYIDYKRTSYFDNSSSPILTNYLTKGEVFDMWSQEIRVLSARGGSIEWEAGAHYQIEDLDGSDPNSLKYVAKTVRGNIRQPIRVAYNWQDSRWMSAFASLTYNFLADKASIDIGGRYTDVKKDGHTEGFSQVWIFNINPFTGTQVISTNLDGTVRNVASTIINCAGGHVSCGQYGAGFWTGAWRANDIPDAWHTRSPVGVGPLFNGTVDNSKVFNGTHNHANFDPQIALRYRPNENLSLYGRWATAFKSGGLNITAGTQPADQEAFESLLPEYAETFELGAKGTLLDGAAMYNVTLFTISVKDLQVETNIPRELAGPSGSRRLTNAGKQRTQGLEFDLVWAASERLTAGLSGALMDGKMISYPGAGCTDAEFEIAATGPCLSAAESIAQFGTNGFQGTIDRTGYKAPRTPDWKFVLDLDYWYPVFDQHKVTFTSATSFSDGWVPNVASFDQKIKYDKRVVANLTLGYGDLDETWKLNIWVRNLLGRSQGMQYFPEFDPFRAAAENPFSGASGQYGIIDADASTRDYTTYGVQFSYNYN